MNIFGGQVKINMESRLGYIGNQSMYMELIKFIGWVIGDFWHIDYEELSCSYFLYLIIINTCSRYSNYFEQLYLMWNSEDVHQCFDLWDEQAWL